MSPFGDLRYGIRYLRRLWFFISGPNELTEPKFNTHTLKDLYNLIKKIFFKNFVFFLQRHYKKSFDTHNYKLLLLLFYLSPHVSLGTLSRPQTCMPLDLNAVHSKTWLFFVSSLTYSEGDSKLDHLQSRDTRLQLFWSLHHPSFDLVFLKFKILI